MSFVTRCASKGCLNTSQNSTHSFFRFPPDHERAKLWLEACHREDLLSKIENIHNTSYRLCGDHFNKNMFANERRTRLRKSVNPVIFPTLEGSSDYLKAQSRDIVPAVKVFQTTGTQTIEDYSILTEEDLIAPADYNPAVKTEPTEHQEIDIKCSQPLVPLGEKTCNVNEIDEIESETSRGFAFASSLMTPKTVESITFALNTNSLQSSSLLETSLLASGKTPNALIDYNKETENISTAKKAGSVSQGFQSVRQISQGSKNMLPVIQDSAGTMLPIVFVNTGIDVKNEVECRACGEFFEEDVCSRLTDVPPSRSETIKELLSKCIPSICSGLGDSEYICNRCNEDLKICIEFIERCINADKILQEKLYINVEKSFQEKNCTDVDKTLQEKLGCINDDKTLPDELNCINVDTTLEETSDFVTVEPFENSTESSYVCQKCSKKFTCLSRLTAHLKVMKDNPTCSFVCGNCRKVFRNKKYYKFHCNKKACLNRKERRKKFREEKKEAKRQEIEGNEQQELDIEKEKKRTAYLCDTCGKTFPRKGLLNSHSNAHWETKNKVVCPECGKMMSISNLRHHIKTIHGPKKERVKQFMCDQCPKIFSKRISLQQHRDYVHENCIKYKCDECNKTFMTKSNMQMHVREVHLKESPFKCLACNTSYARKDNYRQHLLTRSHKMNSNPDGLDNEGLMRKRVKYKGGPCICRYCSKVLKNETCLKAHYLSHVNYRPFKCSHCSLRFSTQTTRDKHQKVHLDPAGHLRCDICYRKYNNEEELTDHKTKHKLRFICEHCHEGFGRKYLLDNHMAVKHNDKKEEEQFRKMLQEKIQYVNELTDVSMEEPKKIDNNEGVTCPEILTQKTKYNNGNKHANESASSQMATSNTQ